MKPQYFTYTNKSPSNLINNQKYYPHNNDTQFTPTPKNSHNNEKEKDYDFKFQHILPHTPNKHIMIRSATSKSDTPYIKTP